MDYTQEQIDEMIRNAVKEATTGLYTQEDLTKKVTSEVDRRVETGIQKGWETQRKKIEAEIEARAKLTAEELAKQEFEAKVREVEDLERNLKRKSNMLTAKTKFAEKGIPKTAYNDLLETLITDDETATNASVDTFIGAFESMRNQIETEYKSKGSDVPTPKTGDAPKVDSEAFKKMGYKERLELKTSSPELYQSLIK